MKEFFIWLMMGLIEGVTDIFPVSSTAHMLLVRRILDVSFFDLSLATGLHGGSLLAIAFFFRRELKALWLLLKSSLRALISWSIRRNSGMQFSSEATIPYLYGLSLVPVAIEGWKLRTLAANFFDHDYVPLLFLIGNGFFILVTAWFVKGERTIQELHWNEFFFMGIFHGIAVIPGVSRLGLVLCLGLWYRLKWQEAVKLTFILSIPVVIGALAVEVGGIAIYLAGKPDFIFSFFAGNLFAFISSWLGLKLLTSRLLERRRLALFGYYCVMLGTFSTLYLYYWR